MIYTLTLNPAVDYHVSIDRLIPAATNRARTASVCFGGKGINVSLVLRALGVPSVAGGFVAGFTGEALEAHLQSIGLDTDFLHLSDGMTRINVKLSCADKDTEINAPGPSIPDACLPAMEERLARLGPGDTLVMAGSLPTALPSDWYARLSDTVAPRGVRVVVDTAGEALRAVLPSRPFLVKPNLSELEEITGCSLRRTDGAPDLFRMTRAAEAWQSMGARHVLVTLGADGALLLDAQGQSHIQAAPGGEILNTVGAGDSAVAGFLAGIDAGMDFPRALRLAVASGSATAMSAHLATREMIEHVLAKMDA